jgi:hypothetical protein
LTIIGLMIRPLAAETISVYPSGSAAATCREPIVLPAPGLFSMNTVCPRTAGSALASTRAITSTGPPAGVGTMMRIGRLG